MSPIAHHLLGQTRSAVLAALLLHPEASLHVRELARLTGASAGSLHRELRALSQLGLLFRKEIGRQVHYQANPANPIFDDLVGLLRKTAGVADVLRQALAPLGSKVSLAFVYGSVAAGTERPGSDVDLMVLGSATFADLVRATSGTQETLRRQVNPTAMSARDFGRKVKEGDAFATNVVAGARVWLIGDDHELAELVAHRKAQGTRAEGGGADAPAGRGGPQSRRRRRYGGQRRDAF